MKYSILKQKLSRFSKTHIFWLLIVWLYLSVGAWIFKAIEGDGNVEQDKQVKQVPARIIIDSSFAYNVTKKHGQNMSLPEFTALFRDVEDYIRSKERQGTSSDNGSNKKKLSGFQRWLYFCFITVTTIGYGDVLVVTPGGKVMVIFYALFGIPMMLVLLGMVGNALTHLQLKLTSLCRRNNRINSTKISCFLTIISNVILFVAYLTIGAAVTSHQENWSYLDAIYFWFVTFSTIGYGDLTAHGNSVSIGHVIGWVLFRLIGLAMVASVIDSIFKWLSHENSSDKAKEMQIGDELERKEVPNTV